NGDIYITGSISGNTQFGLVNLNNVNDEDVFIARISSNGIVQWARLAGYGPGVDRGFDIAVDASGIYITGGMEGLIDFENSGMGIHDQYGIDGKLGTFLAKYDANGYYLSAKPFISSLERLYLMNLSISSSSLYTGGYFRDTLSFDDTTIISSSRNFDMFGMKTDLSLNTSWFFNAGGIKNEYVFALEVDASGNMYLGGSYWSPIHFGVDSLKVAGLSDMMVVSLNTNGQVRWSTGIGNASRQAIYSISAADKLYISGEFTGTINWGSSSMSSWSADNHQAFTGTMDFNGNLISAVNIPTSNDNYFNNANSVVKRADGLYISGYYHSDSLYFGSDVIARSTTSNRNGFIAKFGCPDTITFEVTPVTCVDGMGMPVSSDGTAKANLPVSGSFSYAWSNGGSTQMITGLDVGNYSVTVSDSYGCNITGSTYVGYLPSVTASITYYKDVSCTGWSDGEATVTAQNGSTPYSYLWSNGANTATVTGLAQGTYYVTVTDQCTNQVVRSVVIGLNTLQIVSESTTCTPKKQCLGTASIQVTGGTSPYNYIWNNGGTTPTITNLCKGVYKVTVTDALGCQLDRDNMVVHDCQPGELPAAKSFEFTVYPSPAKEEITVSFPDYIEPGTDILIMSQYGQLLRDITVMESAVAEITLSTIDLPPGIYYIQVRNSGYIETQKFIVGK
ncbi:MAG: T9SS type A sorting domain-containing protein, partial [Bacteroidota bacterium]